MDKFLLQQLRNHRPSIRREWMTLLRREPVATPMGNPDTLAHLIDHTLTEIFTVLGRRKFLRPASLSHSYDEIRHECACGRNPLLAYFLAGERALLEALMHVQAQCPEKSGEHPNNLTELYLVVHSVARREVNSFCSLCQHRPGFEKAEAEYQRLAEAATPSAVCPAIRHHEAHAEDCAVH